jgi:hypothetical protein
VPVVTLLLVELFLFGRVLANESMRHGAESWFLPTMFLAGMGVFVADLVSLVWVGWWAGVVSKNASSAVSSTYVRLMLLPWLVVAVGAVLAYLVFDEDTLPTVALLMWIGSSLWLDWFFARRARRKLFTELRGAAVERYSGSDPAMLWWRRLGRRVAQWRVSARRGSTRASAL